MTKTLSTLLLIMTAMTLTAKAQTIGAKAQTVGSKAQTVGAKTPMAEGGIIRYSVIGIIPE